MTNSDDIVLIEPTEELRSEFLSLAEEHLAAGEDNYREAVEDFDAYLGGLRDYARGVNLRLPHHVQQTDYWLVRAGRVLGASKLRHRLNTPLLREGGHIGYAIRPSERRKGYGTLVLKLTLEKARALGLKRVLLTCDTDNTGSARIIEKNGGRLSGHAVSERSGKQISQYWIEL